MFGPGAGLTWTPRVFLPTDGPLHKIEVAGAHVRKRLHGIAVKRLHMGRRVQLSTDMSARISGWTAENEVAEQDRERFVAIIESEILSLQEWNVARYPVTPNQYKAWLASAG